MKIGLQLDIQVITPEVADALNALAAAELAAQGLEPSAPVETSAETPKETKPAKPASKADLRKDEITAELEEMGATPPPRKSSVKVFEETLERAKTKADEPEADEPEAGETEADGDEWDTPPASEPEPEEAVTYDYTKTHALAKKVVLKHEPAKVREILDEVCGEGVGLREVFDSGDNKKIAELVKAFEKASGSKY